MVEKRKSYFLALLEQPWSRELFQAYCRRLTARKLYPSVPGKVAPAAMFFEELDRTFAGIGEITADALLDKFEPEHLRRNGTVVSFLADALSLQITVAGLVEADGKRRLKGVKANMVGAPWEKALGDFETFLRRENRKSRLSNRTISSYLRVAAALFASAGKEKPEEIIDKDIERFVQFAPGSSASLTAFTGYARQKFGMTLKNLEKRKSPPKNREQRLVDSVRNSLEMLRTTNSLPVAKAHLVRLLSRLYGYRLKDVAGIQKTDVEISSEWIMLRVLPGEEPQEIRGEIFELSRPWIERILAEESTNPFLFEGRSARSPMAVVALPYHKAG